MIKLNSAPSRIAVLCLGIAIGIIVCATPLLSILDNTTSQQRNEYGQALVDATARQAMEPAFRQDLISLRAILQATVSNPQVLQATIHNVENRILVQAGKEAHQLQTETLNYQATITLQDSVAGVVTLSLTPTNQDTSLLATLYKAAALLLFALGAGLIIRDRCIELTIPTLSTKTHEGEDENSPLQEAEENDAHEKKGHDSEPLAPEPECAYAALMIKNLAVLKQQLNGSTFRSTLAELENKLEQIGQLYGMVNCRWHQDRYVFQFASSAESDALFHATCAARMMLDLTGIVNRIPLDLSAQVAVELPHASEGDMPFVGLAVHLANDAEQQLSGKLSCIEISESDKFRKLVSEFAPSYESLLKKQMAQFSN